ncbi:MAG: SufD family Fe-S cluster assembly protein [Candidatus Omnitrophota bacterium]|nr:MAG: SufD family Fe-S cluster assembly protein [Candidatus Omnitrophota bacterium]RKY46162.1 MAG: SufD family Fe-S cluster assembly protein [Candidatus Omnitrophota bacterium]
MRNLDKKLDEKEIQSLANAGLDISEKERIASFLQSDDEILISKTLNPGVEILPIEEALEKYPWSSKFYGKSFQILEKDFPKDTKGGYFIWVKKGVHTYFPIQACLFLKKRKFFQKVHNLIIAEEGAKVYIITGCTVSYTSQESHHLGISEFFAKKGAYINFTMIHSWKEDTMVEPESIAILEEGATFLSNYICLHPVRKVSMYPTAVLLGSNSKARFTSLLLASRDSFQDIGSRVIFRAPQTSAEVISRGVSTGGKIIARGHLKAESPQVKAHLECRGLLLSSQGVIHAIPELETNYQDVDISHEAAIGKISKDEIEYLASRGLSREEATGVIIRGFMDTEILSLPQVLKKEIDNLTDQTVKKGF